MSYRCTKNLASRISIHNSNIINPNCEGNSGCNCRVSNECPVDRKCLQSGVVYQAIIAREDGIIDTYVGMTANSFKDRWRNHMSSFRTRNPNNSTTISKYIWDLQDKNIQYSLKWRLIAKGKPYNHVTDTCRLCIREKYLIIFQPDMASINSISEIIQPEVDT